MVRGFLRAAAVFASARFAANTAALAACRLRNSRHLRRLQRLRCLRAVFAATACCLRARRSV